MMQKYQCDQQRQRSYSSDTFSSDRDDHLQAVAPTSEQPLYSNIDYGTTPLPINPRPPTPVHRRIPVHRRLKTPKVIKQSSPAVCQVRPSVQSAYYPLHSKARFVPQRGTLHRKLPSNSTFSSTSSFECVRPSPRPTPATSSMVYPQFLPPPPPQIIYWPIPYATMLPTMMPIGYQLQTQLARTSSRARPHGYFQSMTQQTVY